MGVQLRVIKTDGTAEQYLHTKVIGTINNALSGVDRPDIAVAEELAEVVTYYLYKDNGRRTVASNEILSMVKTVLAATGHEDAAAALNEHYYNRRIRRSRIEVVHTNVNSVGDATRLCEPAEHVARSRWDKSRIISDLTKRHKIPRQTARTIGALVEERVFNMRMTQVPASLVEQLVLSDTASVLRAQRQLQTA